MALKNLFTQRLQVVNVGISSFKDALDKAGAPAVQVDWRPPLGLGREVMDSLASHKERIAEANKKALDIILQGRPALIGMGRALDTVPGMGKDLILHAGPPVSWERMCGPMKGAILGALIYEGMAPTP